MSVTVVRSFGVMGDKGEQTLAGLALADAEPIDFRLMAMLERARGGKVGRGWVVVDGTWRRSQIVERVRNCRQVAGRFRLEFGRGRFDNPDSILHPLGNLYSTTSTIYSVSYSIHSTIHRSFLASFFPFPCSIRFLRSFYATQTGPSHELATHTQSRRSPHRAPPTVLHHPHLLCLGQPGILPHASHPAHAYIHLDPCLPRQSQKSLHHRA